MVTDRQVRLLMKGIQREKSLAVAAAKAGMSEKTARRYRDLGKLPGEIRPHHDWRTRQDPFEKVWAKVRAHLELEPRLEARTLFDALQRQHPGEFADGQLRTLQRRVKTWRALEGPAREVYFPQVHEPGRLCESDFTHMTELGMTMAGRPFEHLVYHFVLTYSNWETGTICFSESFESLSDGLQNALWELGGVPAEHRTDRLTAAVHKTEHPEEFTQRYEALLRHYLRRLPFPSQPFFRISAKNLWGLSWASRCSRPRTSRQSRLSNVGKSTGLVNPSNKFFRGFRSHSTAY